MKPNGKKPNVPKDENEQVFALTEDELEELRKKAKSTLINSPHNWKQRGIYITCTSCPFPHATSVGTRKIMTGIDVQGMPILEDKIVGK